MRSQLIFLRALAMVALTIAVWLRMFSVLAVGLLLG